MQTMIMRIALKFFLIVFLFFGCWTLLRQVDWMKVFNLNHLSERSEKQLGDLYAKYIISSQKEITDPEIFEPVDSLLQALCRANDIAPEGIKLHILESPVVNAFALPDGHMILYSGLIKASENEAELSGIIAHELAHIRERHVMQKLRRELGLTVLLSISTGQGSETIRNTAKVFTSSAYDRDLEREADQKAIGYLHRALIPHLPMADFLERLAEKEHPSSRQLEWISTHPNTLKRVDYIRNYRKGKSTAGKSILDEATWLTLQQRLSGP